MKKLLFLALCGLFAMNAQAQSLNAKYIQIKKFTTFRMSLMSTA